MWRGRTRLPMRGPNLFTGELEGRQRGPGTVTVLTYGEDAERLRASMEGIVRTVACHAAEVTLRSGLFGAPDRLLAL